MKNNYNKSIIEYGKHIHRHNNPLTQDRAEKLTRFSLSMRFCSRCLLSALELGRITGEQLVFGVFLPAALLGLEPEERRDRARSSRWFS